MNTVQPFNTHLKEVASLYLRSLDVKVTASSLLSDIECNPHYPSLLALSDTFDRYHINNYASRVDAEHFVQLTPPFIAFVKIPGVGKDFVLVKSITPENVSYLYDGKKPQTLTLQAFLNRFQNIVWIAETDAYSGETDYEKNRKRESAIKVKRTVWVMGLALLLLALVLSSNTSSAQLFAYSLILSIKLIGLAAAVLLLVYELDKGNAFVKNICSAGGQTNCDAVLTSNAAKIMGISWGEIGLFYFASTTLWLLVPSISFADKIPWIAGAGALAATYILFSIYYQWRVVKQWCPLCLTVQAVLFFELIWSVANFWASAPAFSAAGFSPVTMGSCLLLPILAWYGLKPVFVKARDAGIYTPAYKRLQYNPDLFTGLLRQQSKAPDGWQHLGIRIGNPDASNIIIKVCSPYCGPCAAAHPILEDLIKQRTNVQLRIIFTVRNRENDKRTIAAKHLLAIAAEGNSTKTQQALDDWYLTPGKAYDLFAAKYPMNGALKQQDEKIEAMGNWCDEAEITHTPSIFVNGYRLPENYNIEELKNVF